MKLPAKDPVEIKLVEFLFANQLDEAVTLVSATVSCTVQNGVDAAYGSVLSGAAVIVGTTVLQRVQAGVDGVDYRLSCVATDANALVHKVAATMPVRTLIA